MIVRESPDELTLGAEEVGMWVSCINVDHIAKERWGFLLVATDWCAFCQALYKRHPGEKQNTISTLGRAPQRSDCGTGWSAGVCWEFVLGSRVLGGRSVLQWLALASKNCGKSRSGRPFGLAWIQWIVCVYAQRPWSGMCQGSMGRMASSLPS